MSGECQVNVSLTLVDVKLNLNKMETQRKVNSDLIHLFFLSSTRTVHNSLVRWSCQVQILTPLRSKEMTKLSSSYLMTKSHKYFLFIGYNYPLTFIMCSSFCKYLILTQHYDFSVSPSAFGTN